MSERKNILLRLDPAVHDALSRWAADELRSTTAQIEFLLRQALTQAGRLPGNVGGMPRRGRPPKNGADEAGKSTDTSTDTSTDPSTDKSTSTTEGSDEPAGTDSRSASQGADT